MAHPQNSPRGLFSKKRVSFPSGANLFADNYSATTSVMRFNSTGVKVPGITLNNTSRVITSDSTGIKVGSRYISTNSTGNLAT